MKIVRVNNVKINYYTDFELGTFFNVSALNNRINKDEINFDLLNAAIFYSTNNERYRLNLPICNFHDKLLDSSILHSLQMKLHDFFSHENPIDNRYRNLDYRLNTLKSNTFNGFYCIGENIADYPVINSKGNRFIVKNIINSQQYFSLDGLCEIHPFTYIEFAKTVVDGWMNSPGHRHNILNPAYKFLGCGCANYERKENAIVGTMTYFKITQNFGGDLITNIFPSSNTNTKKNRIVKKQDK